MPFSVIFSCIIIAIVAFLLGSIPCGVLIGRILYKGDPRDGGSGSIGATNMNRQFGWKAALLTFVGDVAKGALATGFARIVGMFVIVDAAWQFDLMLVLGILFAILGHIFCPWLGFHGGKGVSTGLGSIFVAYPLVVICMLATFLVIVLITRWVSLGSICAAISFPIYSYIFCGVNVPLLVVSTMIAIFVVYAHRSNIVRIANGTESKFSFNRSSGKKSDEAGE